MNETTKEQPSASTETMADKDKLATQRYEVGGCAEDSVLVEGKVGDEPIDCDVYGTRTCIFIDEFEE